MKISYLNTFLALLSLSVCVSCTRRGSNQSRGKNIPYNQNQDQDQEDQDFSQLHDSSRLAPLNLARPAPDRKVAIVAINEGKAYFLGDVDATIDAARTLSSDLASCVQSVPVDETAVSSTLNSIYGALKFNPSIEKLKRPSSSKKEEVSMATLNYDKLAFALVYGHGSIYQDELDFIGGYTKYKPNESFLFSLREPLEKHFIALRNAKETAFGKGSIIEAPTKAPVSQNLLFIYLAIGIFVICASVAGVVYFMRRRKSEPVESNIEFGEKKF